MASVPPGSMGLPFVGEALAFLKDPFAFTLDRTRRHGHVWKTKILSDKVVVFAGPAAFGFFMDPANFTRENGSPKFLQELLHPEAVPFIDGERHQKRKRLLLAGFTPEAMTSYQTSVFAVFERFASKWAGGGEQRLGDDMPQLGFDLADVLFAASDPQTSNTAVANDFNLMNRGALATPINLPFTAYGKAIRARDRLRKYIQTAVATKDGTGSALGVLKAARSPAGDALPTNELEIELLHFYVAAHGPFTAALAWLLVVVGERPELAAKLRAEADGVFGAGVAPTLEQAKALPLARAVSREVLRAFPHIPVTFFGVAKQDLEYGGFAIPRGWKGMGAIWANLQDTSTFEDPTQFDAGRMTDEATAKLPAHAFVPQGGGPPDGHRCAGEALTAMLMPAFVAWFTRNYELAWPAQDSSPGPGGVGPLPRDGMRATVTRRK